jgi:nitroreductase
MDIAEAINSRKSIRAFEPRAVPREILSEIVEIALRAPSWANTQPWEFALVGGRVLAEIHQAFMEKGMASEPMHPDLAAPQEFPERYNNRRRVLGRNLFELKGIGREDRKQRAEWGLQGLKLFGAPNVIYVYTERSYCFQADGLSVWPAFDCGLVAENIMLLAPKYGLGTVPEIQAVAYPEILREILEIPASKVLVLGLAIGYPDWEDPVNQLQSERDPLDKVARWYGIT